MMCTTVLHATGVCHRTSTPHKSGNKEKKLLQIPCSGPDKCNIIKEDNGIGRKHK